MKWEQEAELEYSGDKFCKIHLNSAQGWKVFTWDEKQCLPLLPHNQPLANGFSPSEKSRTQSSSYLYEIQGT